MFPVLRTAAKYPQIKLSVNISTGEYQTDFPAALGWAFLQQRRQRAGAGAFGDVVRVGKVVANGGDYFII